MRKTLCTLLYRLHLHRLAYKVSPSIYGYLHGKEMRDALLAGLTAFCWTVQGMTEKTEPDLAKHYGYKAAVMHYDELHEKMETEANT